MFLLTSLPRGKLLYILKFAEEFCLHPIEIPLGV